MAFNAMLARFLVQEHLRNSLADKRILTLGRQSINMDLAQAVDVCRSEGYSPPVEIIEQITRQPKGKDTETRYGGEINDSTFFSLFGVSSVDSMDHCAYENCTIVHDLNKKIPMDLYDKYDYIVDGGTLDHVVDIATALENIALMLKAGGRLYLWNACSNYTIGTYCSFSPAFFFDYFATNNFTNCRTFIVETANMGANHDSLVYFVDPLNHAEKQSSKYLMLVFFAQKRVDGTSTFGITPIVSQYREPEAKRLVDKIMQESQGDFCLSRALAVEQSSESPVSSSVVRALLRKVCGRLLRAASAFGRKLAQLEKQPEKNPSVQGYEYLGRF